MIKKEWDGILNSSEQRTAFFKAIENIVEKKGTGALYNLVYGKDPDGSVEPDDKKVQVTEAQRIKNILEYAQKIDRVAPEAHSNAAGQAGADTAGTAGNVAPEMSENDRISMVLRNRALQNTQIMTKVNQAIRDGAANNIPLDTVFEGVAGYFRDGMRNQPGQTDSIDNIAIEGLGPAVAAEMAILHIAEKKNSSALNSLAAYVKKNPNKRGSSTLKALFQQANRVNQALSESYIERYADYVDTVHGQANAEVLGSMVTPQNQPYHVDRFIDGNELITGKHAEQAAAGAQGSHLQECQMRQHGGSVNIS